MDKEKLKQKIMESVEIDAVTGCWNWVRAFSNKKSNRPLFFMNRRKLPARKVSFECFVGDIFIENLIFKTSCLNYKCVNPEHIILKNRKPENECRQGHSLSDAYLDKHGRKQCRTCILISSKNNRDKKNPNRMAHNSVKTECKHGHSLEDAFIDKKGYRICITCRKIRDAKPRKNRARDKKQ